MASGINTYSNISSFVNTVFEDALFVAREMTLATGLVTVFNDRSGMALRKNQIYGTATMAAIGEDDDLTSQVFTPSALSTLTPAEYGGQFFITDQRMESDPFGARQDAAQELGAAMATTIDQHILGNLSSLTGGTVGASGTTITWGHFNAMLARLTATHAPRPYMFVLHPYHWHSLAKSASVAASARTNAPEYLMEAVARNYYVGSYSGVDIYVTSNVQASGTDFYAGMWSRAALAYDVRRAPRLEPERDASRRGLELNMTAVYAHGTWRPGFGIQFIGSGTAPSS